jgi:hypothetical protein
MKIENLKSEKKGNRARVAATVIWEDCDRPTHEVYFETEEAFAEGLSCNPHAFLVGCIVPAMHYGEKRVLIDAEICPELRNGLMTAMGWLRHWYYKPNRELVRIEAKTRSSMPTPRTPERAGFFFSGGIDSFTTLRTNRLNFSLEHPWSIKDGLLVYGLEMDKSESFEHVMPSLSRAAQEAGITLIPVYTNIYLNYRAEDVKNRFDFWTDKFEGSAFAAIAHAFARRFTGVTIASSFDIPNLHPHGSHPVLDPNYGSSDLWIRHDGIALTRLEKVKSIADWDVALQHLRVCNRYERYQLGKLNCGQCEKCIRTMLALLALGVLNRTRAFPKQDVSEKSLRSIQRLNKTTFPFYGELIAPLRERGRHDLVDAIECKIAEYQKHQKLASRNARIRQFDQRYLNGNLVRFKRSFSL